MPLISRIFRNDRKLEACLISDPAHLTQGATGEHVGKLQTALTILDGAKIEGKEIAAAVYGPSTAAAVLAYKKKRRIINLTYQTQADNIVGKMTIAALDREMVQFERGLREYNSCSGQRNRHISR
jgi:peptidoglycan hydrolase-like protein with peptidoglycan-binding domain